MRVARRKYCRGLLTRRMRDGDDSMYLQPVNGTSAMMMPVRRLSNVRCVVSAATERKRACSRCTQKTLVNPRVVDWAMLPLRISGPVAVADAQQAGSTHDSAADTTACGSSIRGGARRLRLSRRARQQLIGSRWKRFCSPFGEATRQADESSEAKVELEARDRVSTGQTPRLDSIWR